MSDEGDLPRSCQAAVAALRAAAGCRGRWFRPADPCGALPGGQADHEGKQSCSKFLPVPSVIIDAIGSADLQLWKGKCMCAATTRPRPVLQQAGIVDAAMVIAREQGLAAVSMRSVAAVHHVQPMSLYHHVRNKAELLALMVQRSLSQLPQPDPTIDPTRQLTKLAVAMHRVGIANPALVEALAAAQFPDGPTHDSQAALVSMAALSQRVAGLLQRCGVPDADLPRAWRGVITVLVGSTFIALSPLRQQPAPDAGNRRTTKSSRRQHEHDLQFHIEGVLAAAARDTPTSVVPPGSQGRGKPGGT